MPQAQLACVRELYSAERAGLVALGSLVREIVVAGPEVTGLALSPDGDVLVVSEATGNTITKVALH